MKEYAAVKFREPLDTRYQGPAKIAAYRRWLQRRLVEAEERGDQQEVERVMREMRKAGLTDG